MSDLLRIGILGAARISANSIIAPASTNNEVEITAVAARDPQRAKEYAAKHGIPKVAGSYEELVADPEIDAIYNPLPNGLHGRWTLAAIAAGKHVLCEKPFTANAEEARVVAEAAEKAGLVVMEAFHYRYHPLAQRMRDVVESGELGKLQVVEASFCFPLPKFSDIRYNFDLAGGALMDAGCYAVHMVRLLGGASTGGEPDVVRAEAKLHGTAVDRAMRADLRFPAGHTGRIRCSMWSSDVFKISARAIGEHGELSVLNPLAPQMWHRLSLRTKEGKRTEHLSRRASYAYQLDAFAAAVLRGEPVLTPPADAIANMTIIDSIYTAAGLPIRQPS
ncbi:MAG TPA: Gfo/Idh/MocA family oxidoreductase [Pseudonocardiaceae bacterium]|jgi:predicted dehydrogenase|nr:Gfo/Idh/MocA family oxidoreductase [Pseudonocardiaceae bacterium]